MFTSFKAQHIVVVFSHCPVLHHCVLKGSVLAPVFIKTPSKFSSLVRSTDLMHTALGIVLWDCCLNSEPNGSG